MPKLKLSDISVGDVIECQPDNAFMGEKVVYEVDSNGWSYKTTARINGVKKDIVVFMGADLTDYVKTKNIN